MVVRFEVNSLMRRIDVPEKLEPIHRRMILATEGQIRFYRTFLDSKLKDPAVDLARMLGDPALQTTNRELHAVWDEVRRLYPRLDFDTSAAIEAHLCGFDVI